jgi:cyclic beta-1,2-glucan synthetase
MGPFSQDRPISEHGFAPTVPDEDLPAGTLPEEPSVAEATFRERADLVAGSWEMLPIGKRRLPILQRFSQLKTRLEERLRVCKMQASTELTPQLELLESTYMLESALSGGESASESFGALPHIRIGDSIELPRAMNLAEEYLSVARGIWSPQSLTVFVEQAQKRDALRFEEVIALPTALKLAQLEYILDRADEAFAAGELPLIEQSPFSAPLHSLRRLNQVEWSTVLEPLIVFDKVLRQDPCQAYAEMEEESRNAYRVRVARLSQHADCSEVETAKVALELALEATHLNEADPRQVRRTTHIGYYLFAEGFPRLSQRIGYHPPPMERIRGSLRRWNEDFYILGIFTLSLLLIVAIIAPLVPHHDFWSVVAALLLALLPATQGGTDLVNNTVSALLKAEALPKLDFSKGIPDDSVTLVVVPTLLLSEKQVFELFDELEARYLSNQDPNLHFGLLTDLADTPAQPLAEDHDPLVKLAVQCTNDLNTKYANERGGAFFLLHRRRIFNAREGVWMGWERKRGKLLDLNKLLLQAFDSFPTKAGPLETLNRVRYVITLDSDTQLPRATAARMIGTMAHPLNQAIVNQRLRIVTAGYGILQPRVGVSVASASRSRLASIYSGETGFDIYTRAVSDVYQDLFGEGIFTGKGIYEVSILHQVLDRRFPRNALLSHDLIEGSYARAGLVTDIEIIDDYPSHYSAHTRRTHRWVRGDWQIVQWLFGKVPDESGKFVSNPISTVSRWKIFDNLRRSLVEPVTFLMLILGWFVLPGGAVYWTLATLVLLLLPVFVQFGFNLGRAILKTSFVAVRESFTTLAGSMGFALLNLTFLPHHMFLSLDAISRSLNRRLVSGKRLLEWETAAQAEASGSRTPLDIYLQLSPLVALLIVLALAFRHVATLFTAVPILVLWVVAPLVVIWLNSSPTRDKAPITAEDRVFLREQALYIWRYFSDFGGEQNHWLIPDNVEEKNTLQVRTLSPTNLGMLFNARQAAYEFGFLTLPEFTHATLGTLSTYDRLEKQRGHIYNWYDIETLKAIPPFTVSAVDSGNLAAAFYSLRTGAFDLLNRPVLLADTFTAIGQMMRSAGMAVEDREDNAQSVIGDGTVVRMRALVKALFEQQTSISQGRERANVDIAVVTTVTGKDWLTSEASQRHAALSSFLKHYTPWMLPEFSPLFELPELNKAEDQQVPRLKFAADYAIELQKRLTEAETALSGESPLGVLAGQLKPMLLDASQRLVQLRDEVSRIAHESERHSDVMEFGFLLVESRQLLSIGFDGPTQQLFSSCYDLLASEARIATFLAVAKGDIPQQSWFRLSRAHVFVDGHAVLRSWTGTMFEYMMPALWMRDFPNTLISRSLEAIVQIQQKHVSGIPWGISESGFATTDSKGRYGYQAWGIPAVALKYGAEDGPVISPYSTYLALSTERKEAIANLHRMVEGNWVGAYGLYEAADYTQGTQPELVRSWMAHHLGMSLLALTNLLYDNAFQRWFHAHPRVRAAELLLHERPLGKVAVKELENSTELQAKE